MKYPNNIIQPFCFETTSWSMFLPLNYLVLKSDNNNNNNNNTLFHPIIYKK